MARTCDPVTARAETWGSEAPLSRVAPGLARIDVELLRWLGNPGPLLAPAVAQMTGCRSGKRLRPALALLFSGERIPSQRTLTAAALVELLHVASLCHDDVVDGADERRARPSIHRQHGVPIALMSGDYLLARASRAAADLGPRVVGTVADTVSAMCTGQVDEMAQKGKLDRTEAEYWRSVEGKTAELMALACRLGAWSAGRRSGVVGAAASAGREFGLAYQLVDDLLDICGPAGELGRIPGTDLSQGVITLPVILGLAVEPRLLTRLPGAPVPAAETIAVRLARHGVIARIRSKVERRLGRSVDWARRAGQEEAMKHLAAWLRGRVAMAEAAAVGPAQGSLVARDGAGRR